MPLRPLLLFTPIVLIVSACGASASAPHSLSSRQPIPAFQQQVAPPISRSYVALGASETFGVGAAPFSRGYAYLVAKSLHARHFRNVGIPGATLQQAYDTELSEALAYRPALATTFFGFNDVSARVPLTTFLQDLRDLALTLRSAHTRVLIIGLPDLTLVPSAASVLHRFHINIGRWNTGMRRVARQSGASFLDLSAFARTLSTHPGYISHDGLHPSNRGHAALASVVVTALRHYRLWRFG